MRRLDRWWWIVNLGLLTALAALAAQAINNRVAVAIVALPTHPVAAAPATLAPPDRDAPTAWADTVTGRNLFNAHPPEPVEATPIDDDTPEPPGDATLPGPGDDCERAEGDLKLLATMVGEPAEFSFAVLAHGRGEADQRVVRPGSRVHDGGVVAAIYRRRAVIWKAPAFGCVELGEEPPRAPPTSRARPTSPARAGGFDKSKVQVLGENRYAIDRATLDEQLGRIDVLGRQINVRPHSCSRSH